MATLCIVIAFVAAPCAAAIESDLDRLGREAESYLPGYPRRANASLAEVLPQADIAPKEQRRYIYGLYAQSLVFAGRADEALSFADRVDSIAVATGDDAMSAMALLIRSSATTWFGNPARANALAIEAHRRLQHSGDPFLLYWSSLAVGNSARQLRQNQEALASLREALAHAERSGNANRGSAANHLLSVLHVAMQLPDQALAESVKAFKLAQIAGNVYSMGRAKLDESGAYEALDDPHRELASVDEALAIARGGGSAITEALALLRLTELRLRRREYTAAIATGRQTLDVLKQVDDFALLATAKANLGFALLAAGEVEAGKRLVDDALRDWGQSQSTSGITWLFGKYAEYLAQAGDYKSALLMSEQERAWLVRYEAENHQHRIELLNRDHALQAAELDNQRLHQTLALVVAVVSAAFLLFAAILYRKLKTINRLESERSERLNVQSTLDPLTTLFNRRHFENLIESDGFRQERRRSGDESSVHALLLIDLDHFKLVNDRHGHAAGDAVLVEIARRLLSALRETDVCVRWGGEEFLIFAPATPPARLKELASRILRAIGSEPVAFRDLSLQVAASIGYAPMPLPPNGVMLPWKRAIDLADKACYMAKNHGRNCAFGIRTLAASDAQALATIERDLEGAWKLGLVEMDVLPGVVESADNREN